MENWVSVGEFMISAFGSVWALLISNILSAMIVAIMIYVVFIKILEKLSGK